jgi:hypothetical protein
MALNFRKIDVCRGCDPQVNRMDGAVETQDNERDAGGQRAAWHAKPWRCIFQIVVTDLVSSVIRPAVSYSELPTGYFAKMME